MTLPVSNCQPDKLTDLLIGSLSDIESDAMLSHLESCPRCQVRLEQLAAQDSDWKNAEEILATSPHAYSTAHAKTSEHPGIRDKGMQWTEALSKKLLAPPSHPEMLGKIGRYDIERFVGAGGMGIVFKGFDTELNRPVAIKVLSPSLAFNGTARQRFAREARAAAAVVHEHVVPIYNVESNGELPFLVMHFAQGESLQTKLDREGPLELKQILRIGRQIAAGLAAAHAQGLVHRDVKPANVLIEDGIDRALLTDFGLAQTADDASLTCSGYLPGTPQYMSPEQARGEKLSGISDLFSTGSVLYAMSTGRPPFRAETSLGVLRKINDSEPKHIRELNADIPDWFCRIVERLMAKRPEDRYSSAQELAELLENCLAHVQQPLQVSLPTSLRLPSSLSLVRDKILRNPFRIAVGLTLVGALAVALWPRVVRDEPNVPANSVAAISGNGQVETQAFTGSSAGMGPPSSSSPVKSNSVVWQGEPLPRTPQDEIRASLESEYAANWNAQPLEIVLQELLGSAKIQFDLHKPTAGTENVPRLVTLSRTASRRVLLQQVLHSFALAYIVHEENLEIADRDYASRNPTMHRYDLSHVTANSIQANQLKYLITQVVEPKEWVEYGGNCSLGLFGPILNVRATELMHQQISRLLAKLSK